MGGLFGGMGGLMEALNTSQIDVNPLRGPYSDSFCNLLATLLVRPTQQRASLSQFIVNLGRVMPPPLPPSEMAPPLR